MSNAATDPGRDTSTPSLLALLEHLPGLAYRTTPDSPRTPAFVSEGARGLTGYGPEEFTSGAVDLVNDVTHADDRVRVNEEMTNALRSGEAYAVTYRIITKSGVQRWVREQGCRVQRPGPEHGALEGIIIDVTDAEESRARLHEERARFQDARRLAEVGNWIVGPDRRVTFASEEVMRLLGASIDRSADFLEIFRASLSPEEQARFDAVSNHVLTARPTRTQGQWTLRRPDGTQRVVVNRTVWAFDENGNLLSGRGTMHDITDRVSTEQHLAHSESRFRSLVEASAQVVWHADANGMPLDDLASYLRFTGIVPLPNARARDIWMEAVHPDDRVELAENLRDAYSGNAPFDVMHRLRRHDGEWRQVHGRGVPVFDDKGQLREWVGTITDITDIWRAEEAARLVQSQQVALLQSIPESAWLKGLDGRYVTVNSAYARRIGFDDPAFVIGRHPAEFFPEAAVRTFESEEAAVLAGGESQTFVSNVTLSDGTQRTFETTIAPYRNAAGELAGTVGVSRDVTERRLIQERLARSQKIEALGMLSGGIAHDFNNLLSAIIGGAELARMDLPDGTPAAEDIDEVRRAAVRGAGLTRQLLAFSRKQVGQNRPIDLAALIRDTEPLLRRLLPEGIALDIDAESVCVVQGDVSQLEQVVVNLVVNARDAIKGTNRTGLIAIETHRTMLETGSELLERRDAVALPGGEYVTLAVRDNGSGMNAETLSHIFDPFFTTKRQGEGTGLGLATIASVVMQRGGSVHVASVVGEGTTFTVTLPASDLAPELMVSMPAALPTGTETVLLVEDESVVRVTARRILERNGYTVLEARHGEDALLIWREQKDRVQLIVTDLRMPELGGRELVAIVHAESPALAIVCMSGYANTEELPDANTMSRTVFLPKPFSTESLLTSVRDALDGKVGMPVTAHGAITPS